ncbi:MAG: metal ABC transporter ATP-binding protein [Pseudomonadota bacterium]
MTLVSLRGVTLGHTAPVLRNVDLDIGPGEIVTIVGPNGSGKSTLLQGIIGALDPMQGRIDCAKDLRIGYVPQKLHLDPVLPLSVARFLKLAGKTTTSQVTAALRQTEVEHLAQNQMTALSGGQLQRVMLARALLGDPQLLLLDEATQGLDQPGSARFYQMIAELRDQAGCAVLMVSHELHVVMAASDRVICLNGHICCQGAPEQVASAPEYRALFGSGTQGALALYRHEHNHHHHTHDHDHQHSEK